ncbi:Oidioi.mRNA.OKI2018_I69.chr2.g7679.t1.cds [Oikopleura dioica]|uniref:Oidioi.mRNA.OKI2018_I69.chr2.g7679.t1.cds n=1 Tax=Oikopleura dioica TaxID=34765 RepID=A0ABN7T7Z7_OIKDI|nr:Oidioi.mRNA.OKI2018_I69.chr2.g7679.t1.cds [Oikopleura dioica]
MNEKLERLLPDLAIFKYSIRNPARYDLQIDLVQCVLDRLIETEGVVPLRRATEVLKEYFNKKRSGVCRQLNMSPEKIRTVVFGLAKPFDKRISKVGIINPSFRCINKRMESYIRRGFLLNVRPVYFERIRTWWWDDRIKRGFIRTTKGREIVNRAGCLVRFLIYSQEDSKLEEYRFQLYTEIAERIGKAIEESANGCVNVLTVSYGIFNLTPFFVDEGIIANVVIATRELQFVDRWTIAFVEEKKQRKPKKSKQRVSSDRASSADYRYFSGGDYVSDQHNNSDSNERKRIEKNSLSPTSSRDSQYESLESSINEQKSR